MSIKLVNSDGAGALHCEGRGFSLDAETKAPQIEGEALSGLKFAGTECGEGSLGGFSGRIQSDVSTNEGLEVRRDIFTADDGAHCAVRLQVTNCRSSAFRLHSLTPLSAEGADALKLAGATFADWRVTRMSRNKNDVPGTFSPAVMDENYEDAAFCTKEVKPGDGVGVGAERDKASLLSLECIDSEPCIIIKSAGDPESSGLLIAALGQTEHLTTLRFIPSEDRTGLSCLSVICEFDGVQLDPGDTRTTHWIVLEEIRDEAAALRSYAELLAAEYDVEPPGPNMAVYCSWYFYGRGFDQNDLVENVREISEKSLPIDAFVIDNGWMDNFGTYNTNERFPDGMDFAAKTIREAGMMPGIWTAPFMVHAHSSIIKAHPEMAALDAQGAPVVQNTGDGPAYVLDPTVPYTREYYRELYGRLKAWGYTYHKLDYLRTVIVADETIRFSDPKINRAQAYRMLLQMIRDALGPECYIAACGGIYDAANLGLADGYRSSADVRGRWHEPGENTRRYGALIKIKQNVYRNYATRFWHTDPDAAMLRLRDEPFKANEEMRNMCYLSCGSFSDEEAFTIAVNQYLGGGNVCLCERFADLQAERLALYRHVIPATPFPATILDFGQPVCPSLFWTEVKPVAGGLENWWTLTVGNWEEETVTRTIPVSELPLPQSVEKLVVSEFRTQQYSGVKTLLDTLTVEVPAHGVRVLRLMPWDGKSPVLVGTDLHVSGGGLEIAEWHVEDGSVRGRIETPWKIYPVTVTVGVPDGNGALAVARTTVADGEDQFEFSLVR